jgi:hypothetical protein
MYCPTCNIHYNDPDKRFCETCGGTLVNAVPPPPTHAPRTTQPEMIYVPVGGRPRRIRRSFLLILLVMLLLFLLCGCLMYTNVLAAPTILTDIFKEYTRLGFGCLNGFILLFIFYLITLIFKLDFNCIYVPIGLLIVIILCVILNIIGMIELPDFVDRVVDEITEPIRTLPLPLPPALTCNSDLEKEECEAVGGEYRYIYMDPGPNIYTCICPSNEPVIKPSGGCCPDFNFNNIYYDNGHLYFDIACRLEDFKEQCADGTVYDGAGNFWTDVSCCGDPSLNDNVLRCEGLDYVTAKVGDVRLELEYEGLNGGTCKIYTPFSPPAFQKPSVPSDPDDSAPAPSSPCPSGQSMCGGSCCSDGHCSDGVCY